MELSADGSTLTIGYTEAGLTQLKQRTVEQSIEVIRRRIDETGTLEPTIIRQGEDRIVVQVPGVMDVRRAEGDDRRKRSSRSTWCKGRAASAPFRRP